LGDSRDDGLSLFPYSCTESSGIDPEQNRLTIGAVAKAAGVNVETVRLYRRRALLAEPDKPYGGIRRQGGLTLRACGS
jgi:MerR family mercuric resistance operon transcriptional regulator